MRADHTCSFHFRLGSNFVSKHNDVFVSRTKLSTHAYSSADVPCLCLRHDPRTSAEVGGGGGGAGETRRKSSAKWKKKGLGAGKVKTRDGNWDWKVQEADSSYFFPLSAPFPHPSNLSVAAHGKLIYSQKFIKSTLQNKSTLLLSRSRLTRKKSRFTLDTLSK